MKESSGLVEGKLRWERNVDRTCSYVPEEQKLVVDTVEVDVEKSNHCKKTLIRGFKREWSKLGNFKERDASFI